MKGDFAGRLILLGQFPIVPGLAVPGIFLTLGYEAIQIRLPDVFCNRRR